MHLDRIRLIPVGFRHMTDTRPAGGEGGGGGGPSQLPIHMEVGSVIQGLLRIYCFVGSLVWTRVDEFDR
jgi:hypothetical protein